MRCLTRAIGTFLLILAVGLVVVMGSSRWVGYSALAFGDSNVLYRGWLHRGLVELTAIETDATSSPARYQQAGLGISIYSESEYDGWYLWPPVRRTHGPLGSRPEHEYIQVAIWLPLLALALAGATLRFIVRRREGAVQSALPCSRRGTRWCRLSKVAIRTTAYCVTPVGLYMLIHPSLISSHAWNIAVPFSNGWAVEIGARDGDAIVRSWYYPTNEDETLWIGAYATYEWHHAPSGTTWWPPVSSINSSGGGGRELGIAVRPWLASPMLLCLGGGLLFATRRRKAPTDACPACGYSLTGLPANAACPECGGQICAPTFPTPKAPLTPTPDANA